MTRSSGDRQSGICGFAMAFGFSLINVESHRLKTRVAETSCSGFLVAGRSRPAQACEGSTRKLARVAKG